MELSDKDKFILHVSMSSLSNDLNTYQQFWHTINHIRKHRCRTLSNADVEEILTAMRNELFLSKAMWEEP